MLPGDRHPFASQPQLLSAPHPLRNANSHVSFERGHARFHTAGGVGVLNHHRQAEVPSVSGEDAIWRDTKADRHPIDLCFVPIGRSDGDFDLVAPVGSHDLSLATEAGGAKGNANLENSVDDPRLGVSCFVSDEVFLLVVSMDHLRLCDRL